MVRKSIALQDPANLWKHRVQPDGKNDHSWAPTALGFDCGGRFDWPVSVTVLTWLPSQAPGQRTKRKPHLPTYFLTEAVPKTLCLPFTNHTLCFALSALATPASLTSVRLFFFYLTQVPRSRQPPVLLPSSMPSMFWPDRSIADLKSTRGARNEDGHQKGPVGPYSSTHCVRLFRTSPTAASEKETRREAPACLQQQHNVIPTSLHRNTDRRNQCMPACIPSVWKSGPRSQQLCKNVLVPHPDLQPK